MKDSGGSYRPGYDLNEVLKMKDIPVVPELQLPYSIGLGIDFADIFFIGQGAYG